MGKRRIAKFNMLFGLSQDIRYSFVEQLVVKDEIIFKLLCVASGNFNLLPEWVAMPGEPKVHS